MKYKSLVVVAIFSGGFKNYLNSNTKMVVAYFSGKPLKTQKNATTTYFEWFPLNQQTTKFSGRPLNH